jgi:preprotein translocase subunit SecY
MPPDQHTASAAPALPHPTFSPAEPRRLSWGSRILVTVAALLVCRLGTYIPLPGVEWSALIQPQQYLFPFNMFAGGSIHRLAIFALNLVPYISALIIVQLVTALVRGFKALKKDGEQRRTASNQWTKYLTVLLAGAQSYGYAVALETSGTVAEPGLFFRLSTVITLTGGVVLLMWLGDQITLRGIGNGIALIILSGIVVELPAALAMILELGSMGALPLGAIVGVVLTVMAATASIVFMERARRRLPVLYPGRGAGDGYLTLKLNGSGVMTPIYTASLLLAYPVGGPDMSYVLIEAALIVFFAFFCTRVVFDAQAMAGDVQKRGGFVPGVTPGAATAAYLDHVQTRIGAIGALYLAAACMLPELAFDAAGLPFRFSGFVLLIVVIGALDVLTWTRTHFPPASGQ